MRCRIASIAVLLAALAGCSTEQGPELVRFRAALRQGPDAADRQHASQLDPRWRVAAQFKSYEQLRRVRVPDVRGGFMEFTAVGALLFQLNGQPMQLTAFGEPDSPEYFVMFKDPTNESTTYRGYRIVSPKVVDADKWN